MTKGSSFEQAAMNLLAGGASAEAIARTFAAIYAFVETKRWEGACHATTAIAYVLLGAQDIEAEPCLGEAMFGDAAFDHSWIEIDGAVFDVAIARPLMPEVAQAPVLAGRHVDDGRRTELRYGAVSGIAPMSTAVLIQGGHNGGAGDVPHGYGGRGGFKNFAAKSEQTVHAGKTDLEGLVSTGKRARTSERRSVDAGSARQPSCAREQAQDAPEEGRRTDEALETNLS